MIFNPYSPIMVFFYNILLSDEVFNKMNLLGFIFEKKHQSWSKNHKIYFRQFNSLNASRRRVQIKKKTKCLGSNIHVNVALFCVVDGIFTQNFTVRGGFKQNEYIFEKKKFGPKIPKYVFNSLNCR